jgi:hypothetical protein
MLLRNIGMLGLLVNSCCVQAGEIVWLDHFSKDAVKVSAPWQTVPPDRKVQATHYRGTRWDGVIAIEATAEHSMPLLARPVEVDLN